ncbi:phage major capsid protein [Prochlorococcus sp. AH-736-L15]|nr:phage major capsid protein [Prochlorococcus sp. AH-736-L15]MDA9741471.1 phage major capsid protein [Prochlorococcus sp. AH-736-L15]
METVEEITLQRRYLSLVDETEEDQADTLKFSFSSEKPVSRYAFDEVLDHSEDSVDMTRLNAGAPLLFNHNPDKPIGVVQRAWLDNRKGYARIKWGTSQLAEEIRRDVENGILKSISVGYRIEEADTEEKYGVVRATSWTPYELSVVTIPADHSIGIGRSIVQQETKKTQKKEVKKMTQAISTINDGWSEYERESRNFSIVRALQASVSGNWSNAGLEREVQQELSRANGRESQGIFVPDNGWATRDYTKGSSTQGQKLVGVDHLADRFIDVLRARLVTAEMGATFLPGLVSDVSIPRRTAGGTAYFVAEGSNVTESTGTFDSISMSPKVMGAFSQFSYLMQLQATPEIEELIRQDFVALLAQKLDQVAINGGGSNEPSGILQTSGIGSVVIGSNGGAITLDKMLDLKQTVAVDNADIPSAGFLTNTKVENALSKLKDGNSAYLLNPYGTEIGQQQFAGRSLMISNNVPSNLTKGSSSGVCSAAIYGNFSDLLIGLFGTLELLVDPYTQFQSGGVGIRALQGVDVKVRHPESFGAILDITT